MNEILMCGTDPVGQLYKDTKAEATSIAPIEVSPAESSHSVGTHIMVDGVRYKVTSAISVGDTLTIGTNISAENIEDNLNAEDVAYDSNTSVKEKIDSITDFSTTERVVGHWTDGKPIYEKTVTIPNFNIDQTSTWFPNTHYGRVNVADYFSNADKMWCDLNGTFCIISSSAYRNIMFVDTQLPSLIVFSIPEYQNVTLTLTMRYTKTTD